jgi:hypothetical protein
VVKATIHILAPHDEDNSTGVDDGETEGEKGVVTELEAATKAKVTELGHFSRTTNLGVSPLEYQHELRHAGTKGVANGGGRAHKKPPPRAVTGAGPGAKEEAFGGALSDRLVENKALAARSQLAISSF